MKSTAKRTNESLIDAICAAACFLAPLLVLALFVSSPVWSRDRAAEPELTADHAPAHYAIHATRLDPYVEIF